MRALKRLNRLQRCILITAGCILLLTIGILAADHLAADPINVRPPVKVHSDVMHFSSLQNITETSEAVIIGRVLKTEGPVAINIMADPEGPPLIFNYMVHEVEVLEVASGKLEAGDIITVKQRVDEQETHVFIENDGESYYLSEGETSILFLYDFRDLTDVAPFVPVNGTQGILSSGNVVWKANKLSVSDVKNTLGAEGLGFDEIWKQVVEFASKDKAAVEAEVAGD